MLKFTEAHLNPEISDFEKQQECMTIVIPELVLKCGRKPDNSLQTLSCNLIFETNIDKHLLNKMFENSADSGLLADINLIHYNAVQAMLESLHDHGLNLNDTLTPYGNLLKKVCVEKSLYAMSLNLKDNKITNIIEHLIKIIKVLGVFKPKTRVGSISRLEATLLFSGRTNDKIPLILPFKAIYELSNIQIFSQDHTLSIYIVIGPANELICTSNTRFCSIGDESRQAYTMAFYISRPYDTEEAVLNRAINKCRSDTSLINYYGCYREIAIMRLGYLAKGSTWVHEKDSIQIRSFIFLSKEKWKYRLFPYFPDNRNDIDGDTFLPRKKRKLHQSESDNEESNLELKIDSEISHVEKGNINTAEVRSSGEEGSESDSTSERNSPVQAGMASAQNKPTKDETIQTLTDILTNLQQYEKKFAEFDVINDDLDKNILSFNNRVLGINSILNEIGTKTIYKEYCDIIPQKITAIDDKISRLVRLKKTSKSEEKETSNPAISQVTTGDTS